MNKITKLFEPDGPNDQLISYVKLRKIIGLLGVSLPVLLLIFQPLLNDLRSDNPVNKDLPIQFHYNDRAVTMDVVPTCYSVATDSVEVAYDKADTSDLPGSCTDFEIPDVMDTISEYHQFYMRDVFVGILCILGAILFTYKGADWRDNLLSYPASVFAVVTALAPCYISTFHIIHLIAAFLLFFIFGLFCFIVFVKQVPIDIRDRFYYLHRAQRRTYRICGWIIFICLFGCVLVKKMPALQDCSRYLFWLESIMLWAFGVSWLTSGKFQYDRIKGFYDDKDRQRMEGMV